MKKHHAPERAGQLFITWAPNAPPIAQVAPQEARTTQKASEALSDPLDAFIGRQRVKNFSRYTLRNYRLDIQMAERDRKRPALTFKPEDVEAFMASMTGRGLKAATVQRRFNSLRSYLKDAARRGLIATDPTAMLEPPKKEKRLPIHMSDADVAAMLGALRFDTAQDRREAVIIGCLYYTGMRAGELAALDVEDIGVDTLRVFGKGAKERDLPIPKKLRSILDVWLGFHPAGAGALLVCLGDAPERLSYDTIRRIFHDVMKRADLAGKGYTPHKLRHTFATRLVNKGVRIDEIRKLLGHTGLNTTMIYAHTELSDTTRNHLDTYL